MKSPERTLLQFPVCHAHRLQRSIVGGSLVENTVQQRKGLILVPHTEQGQRFEDLATLEVGLFLEHLVGLLKSFLVVAIIDPV